MLIEIDFQSDEAIYMQLRNQIVLGIATSMLQEGDTLPSVRQLADDIGINMHTVNKAYSVLRQEGFVPLWHWMIRRHRRLWRCRTVSACFWQKASVRILPAGKYTRW